jgi:adenylate kinase family enzyme
MKNAGHIEPGIAFVFIGKPGSGKGTAKGYLTELCRENNIPYYSSDTGECFRKALGRKWWHWFVPGIFRINKRMRKMLRDIQSSGKLQSSVVAMLMWGTKLFATYKNESVLFIDGSPRAILEQQMLESLLHSLGLRIVYLHIHVEDETAIARMKNRHRTHPRPETSTEKKILKRISEFHEHTNPIVKALGQLTRFDPIAYHLLRNESESADLKKKTCDIFLHYKILSTKIPKPLSQ